MLFVLSDTQSEQCTVLAVSQSSVTIDSTVRQQMMNELKNDDQYLQIIQTLENPNERNEVQVNERKYRIKQGVLKVHEEWQATSYNYWRTVVPNVQDIKLQLLRELHAVPYAGHP